MASSRSWPTRSSAAAAGGCCCCGLNVAYCSAARSAAAASASASRTAASDSATACCWLWCAASAVTDAVPVLMAVRAMAPPAFVTAPASRRTQLCSYAITAADVPGLSEPRTASR